MSIYVPVSAVCRTEMEARLDRADDLRYERLTQWVQNHRVTTQDLERIKLRVIQRFGYDDPTPTGSSQVVGPPMSPAERERRRGLCYLPDVNDLSEI